MKYQPRWLGSTDPDELHGEATFTIKGVDVKMQFSTYHQAAQFGTLLEKAFDEGAQYAWASLSHQTKTLMEAFRTRLGP